MNYKEFKRIKQRLEVFEDAIFYSFQGSDAIILESPDRDFWSVPFSFENDQLTLYGKKAQLVEEKIKIDEESNSVSRISELILESASNRDEDNYYEGLEKLVEAFMFERKKNKSKDTISEDVLSIEVDEDEDEDYNESLWEELNESAQNFTVKFMESWEGKVKQIKKDFNKLFAFGFLFDENNNFKRETILDPIIVLETYKNKKEKVDTFLESIKSLDEWYYKAEELGILKESLDGVFPLDKDWKTKLIKNLVLQKRNGVEIPISETLSELEDFTKDFLLESDMTMNIGLNSNQVPGSHNGENQMNFLKVNGVFTITDMEKLVSDFTRAMATYQTSGLNREQLSKVSHYKDIADKMYRTNMIDDETVSNMITDFNTTFGPNRDSVYSPLVNFKTGSAY
jgi:hypothetical protein